jgi:uncharacterized damage-inducible protein DinB
MPGWITNVLRETKLDLGRAGGYSNETTETLLRAFDENVAGAIAAIRAAKDEDYDVTWSLTRGEQVLMSMPRYDILRQTISHLVHHRAQLGVYLRLLDVPVPSMYGPTADEKWGPTA